MIQNCTEYRYMCITFVIHEIHDEFWPLNLKSVLGMAAPPAAEPASYHGNAPTGVRLQLPEVCSS